jgi:hypothetical protein
LPRANRLEAKFDRITGFHVPLNGDDGKDKRKRIADRPPRRIKPRPSAEGASRRKAKKPLRKAAKAPDGAHRRLWQRPARKSVRAASVRKDHGRQATPETRRQKGSRPSEHQAGAQKCSSRVNEAEGVKAKGGRPRAREPEVNGCWQPRSCA